MASGFSSNDLTSDVHQRADDASAYLLANFESLKKDLIDSAGVRYADFRRTLTPHYGRLWLQIAFGYLALVVTAVLMLAAVYTAPASCGSGSLLEAWGSAEWLHYVLLFFHEGMHYNLAADKARSDRLAELFICPLLGVDIAAYRVLHFGHHRDLGTRADAEPTYFEPLSLANLAGSLCGLRAVRTLLTREQMAKREKGDRGRARTTSLRRLAVIAMLHGLIVFGSIAAGAWPLAVAWVAGFCTVQPFLQLIRQTLEHRSDSALTTVDYREADHGAVSRLFGDGPVASTLGAAGFNRHLLHHFDPQVSCTRLRELEEFLSETSLGPWLRATRTTYAERFLRLVINSNSSRRRPTGSIRSGAT